MICRALARLALSPLLLLLLSAAGEPSPAPASPPPPARTIAITLDDLPLAPNADDLAAVRRVNETLVGLLARRRVPAIGFVNEGKLQVPGEREAEQLTTPDARRIMLEIAAGYQRLAQYTLERTGRQKATGKWPRSS